VRPYATWKLWDGAGLTRRSTHSADKVTQRTRHRLVHRKNSARKTVNVAFVGTAGLAVLIAVAAHGQQNTAVSNSEPEAETVVDAHGNLHVPDAYRTTYQALVLLCQKLLAALN
jgi:hypothetical protein